MAANKRKSSPRKTTSKRVAPKVKSEKNREAKNSVTGKSMKAEATKNSPTKISDSAKNAKFDRKRVVNTLLWVVIAVFSFLLVDLLVQYLNNDYSVAVVNGVRLSESEFNQRLEDLYGKTIVDQMITEELVRQEGQDANISISDDEVNKVIAQTKDQLGGDEQFKEALEANNLTEDKYKEDVKLRLIAQKLVVQEPTEEELKNFFESYKSLYFNEEDTYESVAEDVKQVYYNQKFNEQSKDWLDNLKKDSQIQNNVEDQPAYGLFTTTRNIVENWMD